MAEPSSAYEADDACMPTEDAPYCGACSRCLDMAQHVAEQRGERGPSQVARAGLGLEGIDASLRVGRDEPEADGG